MCPILLNFFYYKNKHSTDSSIEFHVRFFQHPPTFSFLLTNSCQDKFTRRLVEKTIPQNFFLRPEIKSKNFSRKASYNAGPLPTFITIETAEENTLQVYIATECLCAYVWIQIICFIIQLIFLKICNFITCGMNFQACFVVLYFSWNFVDDPYIPMQFMLTCAIVHSPSARLKVLFQENDIAHDARHIIGNEYQFRKKTPIQYKPFLLGK